VLALVLLVGPAYAGGGLASDLGRIDFLRTLPLSGARIVLGQTLAPALLLAGIWIALLPAAAFLVPLPLGGFERCLLALALAIAGPPLLLLGVVVQASVEALLPGWTAGIRAFEMGRTMLKQVVHLIAFPMVSIPAALTAAAVIAGGQGLVGWAAAPLAGTAMALVTAVEVALALGIVGRLLDAIDPSDL